VPGAEPVPQSKLPAVGASGLPVHTAELKKTHKQPAGRFTTIYFQNASDNRKGVHAAPRQSCSTCCCTHHHKSSHHVHVCEAVQDAHKTPFFVPVWSWAHVPCTVQLPVASHVAVIDPPPMLHVPLHTAPAVELLPQSMLPPGGASGLPVHTACEETHTTTQQRNRFIQCMKCR
jgi:hypothetical protein